MNYRSEKTTPNSEVEEINKVKRKIPKWRMKSHQLNHKILNSFIKLNLENDVVSVDMLREYCIKEYDISERQFHTNYSQMINIAPKNHAKVFEEYRGQVTLWEPVAKFIKTEWEK